MLTILEGAEKIVTMCMGVKPGERVVIITDINRPESLAKALLSRCMNRGAEAIVVTFDGSLNDGQLSVCASEAIQSADVLLCVTTMTLAYTNAVYSCRDHGCRVAAITDVTEESFQTGALEADYQAMVPVIAAVQCAFDEADSAHITSPSGTDLHLSIKGRSAHVCSGMMHERGGLIGLPAMEVYIAPLENSTHGQLIADASGSGLGKLESPIAFTIEGGRAISIEGQRQASQLKETLEETNNPNSYVIAEFAIGLNPCAELVGHIAVDEGIYGTGHFALGNNLGFGGQNNAPKHLDMVYWKPTIHLDGRPFMEDGKLVGLDHLIPNKTNH